MSDTNNNKALNECGCCELEELEYPKHFNRPGQQTLAYRLATHPTFMRRMRASLSLDQLTDAADVKDKRPLAKLTIRATDDPAIAVLDAWATVADVLTFYQERIANEGFLRTATERKSILELARAIGYELNPGVAASTYLAFTVEEKSFGLGGSAAVPLVPESVKVPKGTQVLSVPGQDEKPQTFETTSELTARPEWNTLKPYTPEEFKLDPLDPNTDRLRLAGVTTGLRPGDAILIIGKGRRRGPESNKWDFRIIQTVEAFPDQGYTQVAWETKLNHDYSQNSDEAEVYALRLRVSLFGHNAPDWQSLDSSTKAEHLERALNAATNAAVAQDGDKIVFGTADGKLKIRIRRSDVSPPQWDEETVAAVAVTGEPSSVAVSADGNTILIGSADGKLKMWTLDMVASPPTWAGKDLPVSGGAAHSARVAEVFISKIGNQALSFDAAGEIKLWNLTNGTESGAFVTDVVSSDGNKRAGSDDKLLGFWTFDASSGTWDMEPVPATGIAHEAFITSVALSQNGDKIISGSADGELKIWTKPSGAWTGTIILDNGESAHSRPVTLVAFKKTGGQILSRSADKTIKLWDLTDGSASLNDVFPEDTLDYLSDWPDFKPIATPGNTPRIYLDNSYPSLAPGSWIVLVQPDQPEAIYGVKEVADVWQAEFNQSAKVAQVQLDTDLQLNTFDRRNTTIYAQSEGLKLFQEKVLRKLPIEGDKIELSSLAPTLQTGQKIAVTGKRLLAKIADKTEKKLILMRSESDLSVQLKPGDVLQLTAQPLALDGGVIEWTEKDAGFVAKVKSTDVTSGGRIQLRLRDKNGFEGYLSQGSEGEVNKGYIIEPEKSIVFERPSEEDDPISEVAEIKTVEETGDNKRTIITSSDPLKNTFDHDITINANVVSATHGETIKDAVLGNGEVLGNGDTSKFNQRFLLADGPLTYIPAPTPTGGESTLEVRVNGVLWQQVPSLYQLKPTSESYMVRHDENGNSFVIFGDGIHGARLPTGQENVAAIYRVGIGSDGQIGAGRLTLLQTKPLGVQEVTNPVSASGAAAPESRSKARSSAPLTTLTLERIVSIQDYEDFAATFAGIGKAQAKVLWNGAKFFVHITIAAADESPVDTSSQLYDNLIEAIDRVRDVSTEVRVDSYALRYFDVKAALLIDSRFSWEAVDAEVTTSLRSTFSFNKRRFGQPVAKAEIIAAIEGVEGVTAVKLTCFELHSKIDPETECNIVQELLPAAAASWDVKQQKALPADLLLIDPDEKGVRLEEWVQ